MGIERKATLRMGVTSTGARRGVAEWERQTGKISRAAGKAHSAVSGVFSGLAAGLVVRQMATTVAGFETTMATIRGVTRASASDFARMEASARELGATTLHSAKQAGEGLLFLARAGFSTDEALAAIPATLDLATAGAIDLGAAADVASNILAQFQLQAYETSRVVDVLVNTANSANTTVPQLGEALKFAGAIAGTVGEELESTAAQIGVLGNSGIQASLAGTNLRGMLTSLLGPTTAGEKAFGRMHVALGDVDLRGENLTDVLETLATANFTASEAVDIFGRRNAAAALILTRSVEEVKAMTAAHREATGVAGENAALLEDTLSGAYKTLISSLQEATLRAGDNGFGGALRTLTDGATIAVRELVGMDASILKLNERAELTSDAIRALGFAGLAYAVARASLAVKAFAVSLGTVPFLAVAAAVSIFVARMIAARDKTDEHRERLERLRKTMDDLSSSTDRMADAEGRRVEAVRSGDAEKEARALRDQARTIEQLQATLAAPGAATRFGAGRLVGVLPSIDDIDELESRLAALRGLMPVAVIPEQGAFFPDDDSPEGRQRDLLRGVAAGARIAEMEARNTVTERTALSQSGLNTLLDEEAKRLRAAADAADARYLAGRDRGDLSPAERAAADLDAELRRRHAEEVALANAESRREELAQKVLSEAEARKELIAVQQFELDMVGKSNAEREKAVALAELSANSTTLSAEALAEETATLSALIDTRQREEQALQTYHDSQRETASLAAQNAEQLKREAEALEAYAEMMQDRFAEGIARPFERFFDDIMAGTESVKDAFEDMLRSISASILHQLIAEPIANLAKRIVLSVLNTDFSGMFGGGGGGGSSEMTFRREAMGGAYGYGGPITAFSGGGVVSEPTTFRFRGGTGIMAEKKPEAVMPLERGSDGQLGVRATGGGGDTYINFHVSTPNADSFRQSERQIIGRLRDGIGGRR